jgi:hypothetical protein
VTDDWFRPAADREQRQEFTEAFVDATHSEGRRSPAAKRAVIAVTAVAVAGGACVGIGAMVAGQHTAQHSTGRTAAGPVAVVTPRNATSPQPSASGSRNPAHVSRSATHAPSAPVTVIQAPAPKASATHAPVRQPSQSPTPKSGSFHIGGEISCISGQPLVGVWVAAAKGSGWASWIGQGNGSTATFSYTLPVTESYSLHVGCGGTGSDWQVATYSGTVTRANNNFACDDVSGQAAYGTCRTT